MLTQAGVAYNHVLEAALQQLAQAGVSTIRLDGFAVLTEMATHPEAFGFTNVGTPYLPPQPETDPAQFLFWDQKHPTTRAQEVLADAALDQLIRTFSPSNGRRTNEAAINALNGLVNARSHSWSLR